MRRSDELYAMFKEHTIATIDMYVRSKCCSDCYHKSTCQLRETDPTRLCICPEFEPDPTYAMACEVLAMKKLDARK